ncbi:MAG: hypothetical protein IJ184_01900, partial [Alphaproteobacteria bacterium]|nr:hypothetical protein [Alphaproteobacteria bacterium]
CNGKYTACKCKSEYTKTCTGEGEEGFGSDCGGKYASCQCKSSYKTCASGYRGVGSACTADGGEKYTSCMENCSSAYRYTCEGVTQIGSGDSCGGKYKSCDTVTHCPIGTPIDLQGNCPAQNEVVALHTVNMEKTCVTGDTVFADGKCYEYNYGNYPLHKYNPPLGIVFDEELKLAVGFLMLQNIPYMDNFDKFSDSPWCNEGGEYGCNIHNLSPAIDVDKMLPNLTPEFLLWEDSRFYRSIDAMNSGLFDTLAIMSVASKSHSDGDVELFKSIYAPRMQMYGAHDGAAFFYSVWTAYGDKTSDKMVTRPALYCMALSENLNKEILYGYNNGERIPYTRAFFLPRLGDLMMLMANRYYIADGLDHYIQTIYQRRCEFLNQISSNSDLDCWQTINDEDTVLPYVHYGKLKAEIIVDEETFIWSSQQGYHNEEYIEALGMQFGKGAVYRHRDDATDSGPSYSICITHYDNDWPLDELADATMEMYSSEE